MDANSYSPSSPHSRPEPTRAQPAPEESVEQYLLSDETSRLIRRKAERLISRAGLPKSEINEVVQALHASLVQASKAFDTDRGVWLAFAERSLQYAVSNMKRRRFTASRNPHRCISLDVLVRVPGEEHLRELAQLITADDLDARTGGRTYDEFERADLRLDLAEFFKKLAPQFQDLAVALESETILEISRRTGTPSSTIYDRVTRIRQLAEDAGLAKYLE